MTALEKMRIRVGLQKEDTAQDDKLNCLLEDAKAGILEHTNRIELLPQMTSLQVEIAVIAYNRETSEGKSSESQGGVSVTWLNGLPKDLKDRLDGYVRLKVSNYAIKKS